MDISFRDALGSCIRIPFPPKRIISLVPSLTELLFDLGLEDEVIGITKFCIHPDEWYRSKTKIGGTKKLNLELIRKLNPDLIIGNKEENTQSDIETLRHEFPVWISDIYTLEDAVQAIEQIGFMVNRKPEADYLTHLIRTGFTDIEKLSHQLPAYGSSILYLIWRNPYMAAGRKTFISDMLRINGFENAVSQDRYPELSIVQLIEINPKLVFLSSEPYPFTESHAAELRSALPHATVIRVDGEMFSWYGSRLVKAVNYFHALGLGID